MSGKRRPRGVRSARILANPVVGILGNPPVLSREVESVTYRHADDGQRYRHDFGKDVRAVLGKDGTVTLRHGRGKPLWEEFSEQPFLVNPPGRKRKRKRAKRTAAAPRAARRRRKAGRRKVQAAHTRAEAHNDMARRKGRKRSRKRSRAVVRHVKSHRRGRIRRNPPGGLFTARGLMNLVFGAATDGALNLGGRVVARVVPDVVGIDKTSTKGLGVQAATGLGMGFLAAMLGYPEIGRKLFGGALSSVGETLLKNADVPHVSSALSDWSTSAMPSAFAAYPRARSLPARAGGLATYPQAGGGLGDYPWAVYGAQQ